MMLIGNMPKRAIQRVHPAVELTRKVLARTFRIPDELIAPMRTHVVEGVDLAVFSSDNENRGATDRKVFHKIIARLRDLLYSTDVEPRFAENSLTLLLEIFS